MELPEQPACDPLPPSRPVEDAHVVDCCGDIHCDGSCQVPPPRGAPAFNTTSWPP